MLELISSEHLTALFQVIMIDLVLAGDNAIVIGLAAAGLPEGQRKKAILIGIVAATIVAYSAGSFQRWRDGERKLKIALPPPAIETVIVRT